MPASSESSLGQRHGIDFAVRSALAGGIAGGIAKTAVAPLERVKILFQTQNAEFHKFTGSWRGISNALVFIWKTKGIRGLYQGHTLTLARTIPHAAISYAVYDKAKRVIMPTHEYETSIRRFLSGSVTGLLSLPVTYPFELIRVRMAIDTENNRQPSVREAIRKIWSEGRGSTRAASVLPFLHFYRGFPLTMLTSVPYRGGLFFAWETLNAKSKDILRPETISAHRNSIHLVIGATAASISEIFIYPLSVIRRRQQASGVSSPERMIGFRETTRQVWKSAGWKGFYAGMGIGLIKQVPLHSISLAVWQLAKEALDV